METSCRQPHQEPWLWIGVAIVLVICLILLFLVTWRFRENPKSPGLIPLIPVEEPINSVTTQLGASIKRDQADSPITVTNQTTTVKSGQSNWVEGSVIHHNGEVFGNHGSIACEKDNNRMWAYTNQSNRCVCLSPFYGSACQLESYDQTFYAIGTANPSQFTAITEPVEANNLSFDTQGIKPSDQALLTLTKPNCTNLCLVDSQCTGVYYNKIDDQTTCQLLRSVPTLDTNRLPTMSSLIQPTLFLKQGIYPETPDQAFLFYTETGNDGQIVLRPWLGPNKADGLYHKVTVTPHNVVEIPFYPSFAVNNSGKQLLIGSTADLSNPVIVPSSPRIRNINVTWPGLFPTLVGGNNVPGNLMTQTSVSSNRGPVYAKLID